MTCARISSSRAAASEDLGSARRSKSACPMKRESETCERERERKEKVTDAEREEVRNKGNEHKLPGFSKSLFTSFSAAEEAAEPEGAAGGGIAFGKKGFKGKRGRHGGKLEKK